MKKNMRVFMVVFLLALVVGLAGTSSAEAAAKKMSKADFVKAVVKQITGKKNTKGKKITVTVSRNGSVKVYSKTVSAKTVEGYKKKNGITTEQAQYFAAAVQLGIIDRDVKDAKKNITYADALAILARADRVMNRDKFTDADVELVVNKRLTGLYLVAEDKQADIAKAWMLGYYAGKSNGNFTRTRTIRFASKATKSDLDKMVKRLTVKKNRYQLSDDFQMLRISKKNRPKQEKYFPYILDDFTNEYYDMEFEFMQKTLDWGFTDLVEGTEVESFYKKQKGDGEVLFTWDNMFANVPYKKRAEWIVEYHNRWADDTASSTYNGPIGTLKEECQYIFPSELEKFVDYFSKNNGKFINTVASTPLNLDERQKIAERAEEYTRTAFSADYRTIDKIATYMSPVKFSDDYIRDAVLNETVVECSTVAADPSSIYYQVGYSTKRMQGYVIRVYVRYRIVSDNGKGGNSIVYNNLERTSTSLREVKETKDGFSYEWAGNDGKWRDGYFELEFSDGNGSLIRSDFDLARARNRYTKLLGGPDQCTYNEPGGATDEGIFRAMNMINETSSKEGIAKKRELWERDYGIYIPCSY